MGARGIFVQKVNTESNRNEYRCSDIDGRENHSIPVIPGQMPQIRRILSARYEQLAHLQMLVSESITIYMLRFNQSKAKRYSKIHTTLNCARRLVCLPSSQQQHKNTWNYTTHWFCKSCRPRHFGSEYIWGVPLIAKCRAARREHADEWLFARRRYREICEATSSSIPLSERRTMR